MGDFPSLGNNSIAIFVYIDGIAVLIYREWREFESKQRAIHRLLQKNRGDFMEELFSFLRSLPPDLYNDVIELIQVSINEILKTYFLLSIMKYLFLFYALQKGYSFSGKGFFKCKINLEPTLSTSNTSINEE